VGEKSKDKFSWLATIPLWDGVDLKLLKINSFCNLAGKFSCSCQTSYSHCILSYFHPSFALCRTLRSLFHHLAALRSIYVPLLEAKIAFQMDPKGN